MTPLSFFSTSTAWRAAGRQLQTWSWPGALGAVLLLASAGLLFGLVPQQEQAQAHAEASLRQARAAARLARSQPASADAALALNPQASFLAAFPQATQRQQRLGALWRLAGQHQLALRRSEFRATADERLGLARYRISLPLEGSYTAVRGFVDEALQQDAALSLDRLRLDRSEPGSPTVRAELQLSLWSRVAGEGL
jgi:hypothetical protein